MYIAPNKVLLETEADDLVKLLHANTEHPPSAQFGSAQLDELIVMALLSTGLRNSEFCALAAGDTILGRGASVFVVRGRPRRGRTVYVPERVSELVEEYAGNVRPRFLPSGVDPADLAQPLLLNEHRRAFDRTGLYRRVVRILTEAGLGDRANVQLLRHTYGYLAYVRTGGNLLFVQRQLGHAHPATTAAYAKLVKESYADLAERILPAEGPTVVHQRSGGVKLRPQLDCSID